MLLTVMERNVFLILNRDIRGRASDLIDEAERAISDKLKKSKWDGWASRFKFNNF